MSIRSTLPGSVPRRGHYATPIPEQEICWAGSAASVKIVSLALQGGGAHGAFAWGVLDRLLEDERIVFRRGQRSEARFRCGRGRTSRRQKGR